MLITETSIHILNPWWITEQRQEELDAKVPMDITATLPDRLSEDKEGTKFQALRRSISQIVLDDIPCPFAHFP